MACGLTFTTSKPFQATSTMVRLSEESIQFLILVFLTSTKYCISFRFLTFEVHGEVEVILGHVGVVV